MDKFIETIRGMDPTTVLIGTVGGAVLFAYLVRSWWTAPVVRSLARVEDAVRRRP